MARKFGNYEFDFVEYIRPELGQDGKILEYLQPLPSKIQPNRYASGPFCKFRLEDAPNDSGVYAITVEGELTYIGECENLLSRFGANGYGYISTRNCHYDGQATNCKVNSRILDNAKADKNICIWFHQTCERKKIETELITKLNPLWNAKRTQSRRHINRAHCISERTPNDKLSSREAKIVKPKLTQMEIERVGEIKTTAGGNSYLECDTDLGIVAFWGDSKDMSNINIILERKLPFKSMCECISSNWKEHAFWVPQTSNIWLNTK